MASQKLRMLLAKDHLMARAGLARLLDEKKVLNVSKRGDSKQDNVESSYFSLPTLSNKP